MQILKKVIRGSDGEIERVEFTVAKKAIKQFQKSHKKYNQKRRKPRAAPPKDDGSNHGRSNIASQHSKELAAGKTSK